MDEKNAITDRIQRLLDGRDKYPWGQSMGLGKGVIDGITRTGSIPGGETLSVIRRFENARIDWLLEGRGSPYAVSVMANDDDGAQYLDTLLRDESWSITVVTDHHRYALVLELTGAYQVKDGKDENKVQRYRTIAYSIVEVIAGALGIATFSCLRMASVEHCVYIAEVSTAALKRIESGEVGTYRLFQAPGALLKKRLPWDQNRELYESINRTVEGLTMYESKWLDLLRRMRPEDQKAALHVAQNLAKYGNTDAPDQTDDDAETPGPAP